MQNTVIVILLAATVFLVYDNNSKKTELLNIQSSVTDLQSQLNNQQQASQQAAQGAEISKLQQQLQELRQQRDQMTQDLARVKAVPAPTAQPNWLQQRIEQSPKLDNPAVPVGPRYWVDQNGIYHYYR